MPFRYRPHGAKRYLRAATALRIPWRGTGYFLLGAGAVLMAVSWYNTFPLSVESRFAYIFDSIYPTLWIGMALSNGALLLIAVKSKSSLERLCCGFAFILVSYSVKFLFAYLEGADSNFFRALTENYLATSRLVPEEHSYYEWPLLFILGRITSETLGLSIPAAMSALFLVWTFTLAGALFYYSTPSDSINDFLAVVVYVIAIYPFLNWQFSAQTFGLVLLFLCARFMRTEGTPARVLTLITYGALVASHGFLALFLVFAAILMALKDRRFAFSAVWFSLLYGLYLTFRSVLLLRDLAAFIRIALLLEYSGVIQETLNPPVTSLDLLGQTVSRALSISVWGLLGFLVFVSVISRKIRPLDVALGISGVFYGIAGAVAPLLGFRAIQVLFAPAAHVMKVIPAIGNVRKILIIFFMLGLLLFPLTLIHIFYDDTNYMTYRDQHAAEVVLINLSQSGGATDFRMLTRQSIRTYIESKTTTRIYYATATDPVDVLTSAVWYKFVFMTPELEKTLLKRVPLTEEELQGLESSTLLFSRVYSNGHVSILLNPNPLGNPYFGA